MTTKHCRRCNQTKNVSEFNTKPAPNGKRRCNYICKECQSIKNRERNNKIKQAPKPQLKMKTCNKCKVEKEVSCFTTDNHQLSGLSKLCKSCQNDFYINNRDILLSRNKQSQTKNKIKNNSRKKTWAKDNPQKIIEANKRYYAKNVKKILEYNKRWCQNNYEAVRNKCHRYRARKRQNTIQHFTTQQLEQRMSMFGFSCAYCGGKFEHIDHLQPISKGGYHCLANLRPSCQKCNQEKFNKTAKQWFAIVVAKR
jgi:hypothetical protein